MFGSKKSQQQQQQQQQQQDPTTKLRFPKSEVAPNKALLKELSAKAEEYRNREIEQMWTPPGSGRNYCLMIKMGSGLVEPTWMLWEDDGSGTKLAWQYQTMDVDLINDCVSMVQAPTGAPVATAIPAALAAPIKAPFEQAAPVQQAVGAQQPASLAAQLAAPEPWQAAQPGQAQPAPNQPSPQAFSQPGQAPPPGFAQPAPQQAQPMHAAPQAQPGFGQPPQQGFGQQPAPQAQPPQGFGQTQPQGQPPQQGFAQPAPGGGFAQPAPGGGFTQPAPGGGFAQPAPGGGFAQPAPGGGFAQPAPGGGFAQPAPGGGFAQPAPGGGFAQPAPGGGFAQPAPGAPAEAQVPLPSREQGIYPTAQPAAPRQAGYMEGNLDDIKSSNLLSSVAGNKLTGKLEIRGEESVGSVYFRDGVPIHATTPSAYGDGAIRELVTWEKGVYSFEPNLKSEMRSVEGQLNDIISQGATMLDQKRHLKRAGLTFESFLFRKHKNLSESELKLMLMKGAAIDFEFQKRIYDYLRVRRTFTDLLRDYPMDSTTWTTLLFNFISCGLLDIKEPDTVKDAVLDFLGADKEHVRKLAGSFVRPETGVYNYESLLLFLEYEFHRFEAYNWPLSLVLFEILTKRQDGTGGTDMLKGQAMNMAAMRINMIKRPLDTLGHFQTLEYALVMPNTKTSSAAWVANRIYESLTATPLGQNIDRNTLAVSFGVASLPADGDDLQSLILAARQVKEEAKTGTFPVVQSKGAKRK